MTVYGKILAVFFLPSPFSLNSLLAPPGFVGLEDVGTLGFYIGSGAYEWFSNMHFFEENFGFVF